MKNIIFILAFFCVGCSDVPSYKVVYLSDKNDSAEINTIEVVSDSMVAVSDSITYPYYIDRYGFNPESYKVIYLDGCEYIVTKVDRGVAMVHKGNCRFCERRRIEREKKSKE